MNASESQRKLADALALQVVVASAAEPASFTRLIELLAQLEAELPAESEQRARIRSCLEQTRGGVSGSQAERKQVLDALVAEVTGLQLWLAGSDSAPRPEGDPRKFELPAWVDEATFREFLGGQGAALEEIEASLLAMECGGAGRAADVSRRVHTLKGEAGIVGLDDLAGVYHAIEDLLASPLSLREKVDQLLGVKDWLGGAIAAYSELRRPEPSAERIVAELNAVSARQPSKRAAPRTAPASPASRRSKRASDSAPDSPAARSGPGEPNAAPAAPTEPEPLEQPAQANESVERDEELVALVAEFLTEAGEGLTSADQILMNAERDGLTNDHVNSLFRTFHSIKGVAGMLEIQAVGALAHTTETLLNQVRQGKLELRGAALDRVFDATEAMRSLMDMVRDSVENARGFGSCEGLAGVLEALGAVIEGRAGEEAIVPEVEAGLKLGQVIQRITACPPALVEQALAAQAASGRRLGEELVASGAAKPREVVSALRAQEAAGGKIKETIKVDLERLDSLVEMIGELVIVESMVMNIPEINTITAHRARNYLSQLTKITRDLQSVGMRMRMVPVRGVFQKMARLVRDLSRKNGKQARITLHGEATEMDRTMVDQVADPLVHMIRNAVDHGLEAPRERTATGKPAHGELTLSAYHEGGSILIELSDDGRGLDRDAILAKARAQGLVREGQVLSDQDVYELIFAPGFSTAKQVTEISGRGVGMDVVKRNIEALRGRVMISSEKGKGTNFKLVLPLTLAIIDGMLVVCGSERYIIPTLSIVESIQPTWSMLSALADQHEVINVRGEILTLLRLDALFNVSGAKSDPTQALVVVVESLGRKLGLVVDDVLQQQQVVIKSMGSGMRQTRFVSGAAILSDGRVGLIVNVDELGSVLDRPHAVAGERTAGHLSEARLS